MKYRIPIAVVAFSASAAIGLALDESFTDHAVIPVPGDRPTMGFGSTEGVKMGDTITPPKALRRFITEIDKNYEGPLKRCLKVAVSQSEYDSLVRLAYNAGGGAVCKEIVPLFNSARTDDDFVAACKAIKEWRITVKKKDCRIKANNCRGLVIRRAEESRLCQL